MPEKHSFTSHNEIKRTINHFKNNKDVAIINLAKTLLLPFTFYIFFYGTRVYRLRGSFRYGCRCFAHTVYYALA